MTEGYLYNLTNEALRKAWPRPERYISAFRNLQSNAWLRGDWCGRGPGSFAAVLRPRATDVAWKWNRDELYDD